MVPGWNGILMGMKETVTALCDVDTTRFSTPNTRRKGTPTATELWPKAKRYQHYREMYQHADDFDAVIISTPDHHHFHPSQMAMKAGKAVYCEKPLTWSVQEARQLAADAARYKVATQMGNQGNANPGWRIAHAYVHAGAIGDVREVHC